MFKQENIFRWVTRIMKSNLLRHLIQQVPLRLGVDWSISFIKFNGEINSGYTPLIYWSLFNDFARYNWIVSNEETWKPIDQHDCAENDGNDADINQLWRRMHRLIPHWLPDIKREMKDVCCCSSRISHF